MKLSPYGINAVFNEPLERPAALKLVRATQMLVLHEFRRYVRIPVITEVSILAGQKRFSASSQELSSGGMSLNVVHLARRKADREKAIQRVKDAMSEIDAMGVQVKDLDIGLLDFPCEVDGEIVLLCWKLGESSITHWHRVNEGFAGRKPVDERIHKAKRTN
jgi:hypothetical protein